MDGDRNKTIHMIGHGHIDPTWLWRWTEGYEEIRATFRSALARMEESPDFKFTASSACFYAWTQLVEPDLFAKIQERVREGRWEFAGGMWIEPDCNVPAGESFVRQGLYAQRFFQEAFGRRCTIGFNPDSFGHAGTLPQILKKLGMDYYVFMRPQAVVERDFPGGTTFWWIAPNGDRVLTVNIDTTYNWGDNVVDRIQELGRCRNVNPGQTHILGFYGVGDHGGGPTRRAIRQIAQEQDPAAATQGVFSSLAEYFAAFESESIPVLEVRDELQYHARGCYSAHSEVKQLIRRTEHALMTAERYATAAWLLKVMAYPGECFTRAWKDLLYNQFHDIIAGTSIPSSYDDARDHLGAARHCANVIMNQAAQTIARDIDTLSEGNCIVVFNPLTWPVVQPVRTSWLIERELAPDIHLVDDEGVLVPHDRVVGERPGGRQYTFLAEVPAMGYRCYFARSGKQRHKLLRSLKAEAHCLENDWWSIELDRAGGHIIALRDKQHGTKVLRAGAVLSCLVDGSDTWSHGVSKYDTEAGRFGKATLQLVQQGDVLARVRSTTTWRNSTAIQEITVYRDTPIIDLQIRVNWQEAYHALKLVFETCIADGIATYEVPYGSQVRAATGHEEPAQQWFDLTGQVDGLDYGFAILNDGTYGCDALGGRMRATLLRSPAYAHHDPDGYSSGEGLRIMDQGWHTFRFQLVPHLGCWQDARVVKQAWELNLPEVVHIESAHPGTRRRQATLMGTESDNVLLTVLKHSEDGADIIIRGYETSGRATTTTLHLPVFQKTFEIDFAPHEIKTIRISPETWVLQEVNLLEEAP
ncbi:MAG: alpha-mannosidase [Candidatus Hydrogenedentes bacterium]|nr:alpha-mannosidase [Candidatus Hydrogenedentota bacterium]